MSKHEKIENEKQLKKQQIQSLQDKIKAISNWRQFYVDRIQLAKEELELKKKAPLPLELTNEWEKLPGWREHFKKAHEISIREEIMKMEAEIFDADNRIKMFNEELEKLR